MVCIEILDSSLSSMEEPFVTGSYLFKSLEIHSDDILLSCSSSSYLHASDPTSSPWSEALVRFQVSFPEVDLTESVKGVWRNVGSNGVGFSPNEKWKTATKLIVSVEHLVGDCEVREMTVRSRVA